MSDMADESKASKKSGQLKTRLKDTSSKSNQNNQLRLQKTIQQLFQAQTAKQKKEKIQEKIIPSSLQTHSSHPNKSEVDLLSPMVYSSDGQTNNSYDFVNCQEQSDSTTQKTSSSSSENHKTLSIKSNKTQKRKNKNSKTKTSNSSKKRKSYTQESHPPIKKKTCRGKSKSSKTHTQDPNTHSLQILDSDSTSIDPGLLPYWKECSRELSTLLSCNTETDSVDLPRSWCKGSSASFVSNLSNMQMKTQRPVFCKPEQTPEKIQQVWKRVVEIFQKTNPQTQAHPLVPLLQECMSRTNWHKISSLLLTTLWPKIMEDARQRTEERENNWKQLMLKSLKSKFKKEEQEQEQEQEESKQPLPLAINGVTKVKLALSQEQKKQFQEACTCYVFLYNQCVKLVRKLYREKKISFYSYCKCENKDLCENEETKIHWSKKKLTQVLRAHFVREDGLLFSEQHKKGGLFLKKVQGLPYDFKDEAIQQFVEAYASIRTNLSKGNIRPEEIKLKYLQMKSKSISIRIQSKHWTGSQKTSPGEGWLYPRVFGVSSVRARPGFPREDQFKSAVTLHRTPLGEYFLLVPYPLRQVSNQFTNFLASHPDVNVLSLVQKKKGREYQVEQKKGRLCAIDPGVRVFGTIYDAQTGQVVEWGKNLHKEILNLGYQIDRIVCTLNIVRKAIQEPKEYGLEEGWHKKKQSLRNKLKGKKNKKKKKNSRHRKSLRRKHKYQSIVSSSSDCTPALKHVPARTRKKNRLCLLKSSEGAQAKSCDPSVLKARLMCLRNPSRTFKNLLRVKRRLYERIQEKRRDFHYRFSNWLCENYEVILIPDFDNGEMVRKKQRKDKKKQKNQFSTKSQEAQGVVFKRRVIHSKTARSLMNLAYRQFQSRLIHVSRRHGSSSLIVPVSEAYTTKCCGVCGVLNESIGSSSVFKCPNEACGFEVGRDSGASRSIYLRFLTELVLKYDLSDCCVSLLVNLGGTNS